MENKYEVDILPIGDVCIDLYLSVEGADVSEIKQGERPQICFIHGSKIPVKTLKTNVAGNAANVSIGAAKLGLKTAIYSETGGDEEAQRIEKELYTYGVDTRLLIKNKGMQTGIHPVIVYGGERTIFSHHEFRPYKVTNWPTPKWLYYTSVSLGFEKFQKELVKYLKNTPQVGVAFNPGTYHIKAGLDALRDILSVSHVLFLNKDEAESFVGEHSIEQLHLELQKLGPKLTIITEGKRGATGHDGKELVSVDAYQMDKPLVDMTGAGDAFAAGTISALNYNKPLYEALLWGSISSSCVIREIGSTHGLPSKEEMEERVNKVLNKG